MLGRLVFVVFLLLFNGFWIFLNPTHWEKGIQFIFLGGGNALLFCLYFLWENKFTGWFGSQKESEKSEGAEVEQLLEQERFKNKEQLSEIDLLREQENYRREFVGNVSHELKTPLFSIQGFLLTLIEGGLDDPKIRDKYMDRISKSVERLIYLTKDLELLSEIENGNLHLNLRAFNLRALVQEVFDLLELKAQHNEIKLEFQQNHAEPVRVIGDLEKLERVIINLVANAINHCNRPATLTVSFRVENGEVVTTIADNGIGIKEEDRKRIFERFYRVEKSRNRRQGGSGVGLAIVKHILEAHQQKIEVESEYGVGTRFRFALKQA